MKRGWVGDDIGCGGMGGYASAEELVDDTRLAMLGTERMFGSSQKIKATG